MNYEQVNIQTVSRYIQMGQKVKQVYERPWYGETQ